MKKIILYLFFALTIVFGREIYANFDVFGIAGLKFNHFLIAFVLIAFWTKFIVKNTPGLFYIWGIVALSLISTYLGYTQGNEGIFFNLNYLLGILFFVVGYHSINSEKDYYHLLKYFTLLFFATYIFKEFQFTLGGTPLLFSLDEIRTTRDLSGTHLVKGSSDSLSTIGSVVLLFYLTNKNLNFRYLLIPLMLLILIRYDVRTPMIASIMAYLVWTYGKMQLSRKFILNFSLVFSVSLIFFISFINIEDYFIQFEDFFRVNNIDNRETFIWRVAMWSDSIQTVINQGFYLIGTSGKTIDFNLINIYNFREYLNPHNSYIYILLNFGILNVIFMLILIFGTMRLHRGDRYSNLFKASYCSLIMFAIYAFGSPIHELIYQAPLFWFLFGAHRKLTLFHYQNKTNLI